MSVKRILDIVVAAVALVVLSPVILLVALLVRIKLGSPVMFRQQRPGLRGRPFELVKFRTMRDRTRPDGTPLPDEERMTSFGARLRAYSLDELPEFWNVLRGDMSLVGPRPLLMQYLGRYTPEQARRHDVRPGLTGLAQVSGRNATTWEQRFALDVDYVEQHTLVMDLSILWRTVKAVVTRDGISADGHATMPEFMGPEFMGPEFTGPEFMGE